MAARKSFGLLAFLFVPFILIFSLILLNNLHVVNTVAHSNRHLEVSGVREHLNGKINGGNNDFEFFFSPKRGTILALWEKKSKSCGIIFRVTAYNPQGEFTFSGENYSWLGQDVDEVTGFCSSKRYWNNVLVRDNYLKLSLDEFKDLSDMFFMWLEAVWVNLW